MTVPITRLFVLVIALFGLLVAWTSRWTVFEAKELRDNTANKRILLEQARIKRGVIRAEDGTVLARSLPDRADTFRRTYPDGPMFAHTVGYSFTDFGRSGLEQFYNDSLTGRREGIDSLIDQLSGDPREGDDLRTTLNPRAQRVAYQALAGRRGAVVAMEPSTGRVRVMASEPSYNPNQVASGLTQLNRAPGSPLLNRATQSRYPPASTFKVVTAIAAIDSGRYTPSSVVSGQTGKVISGVPLQNDGNQSFGSIDLATALTFSVNTVWAEVAEVLGKNTMGRYMQRLGFYAQPPLDYPSDQRFRSGEYFNGRLLNPLSDRIDVGRMGIGQDKLAVTPLQMAMVAAAVANGGVLMKPRLGTKVIDRDGRVTDDVTPQRQTRVMQRRTAQQVGGMMGSVVREGTGTAAALSGIDVAGKTGTAQVGEDLNQVWFIAFAPAGRPRIAIAVTVERSDGTGGEVAAPIAKRVLETLL
jgi:peptidoglycan glycosyltransferase